MGTEYVYKRGGASLNNCAFISTKNLGLEKTVPFEFLMDMSMLGAGVGFDVSGKNSFEIQKPKFLKQKVLIPDTREGWVETMALTLNGFFNGADIPRFDYSEIRPKGSPISGFGGEASGPGPLINLVDFIIRHYEGKAGDRISVTDIVDTFNNIGKCVVSGNVRRSAEIGLCDASDCAEFLSLKDPDLHQDKLTEYRWASNNSIVCPVGADYEVVAEYIAKNGEPGIIWMENAREYGRMADFPNNLDYKADGVNPCCFAGSTLIAVADGRNAVTIKQLVDEGNDIPVYCVDKNQKSNISWMRQFQQTGSNVEMFKVTLDDGSFVRVTANHKFPMRDGSYKEANKLVSGDSLIPFRSYERNGRRHVEANPGHSNYYLDIQSRRIYEFSHGSIPSDYHIHHIDEDKLNDVISNLSAINGSDHLSYHSSGEKNPIYGKQRSDETKRKIGDKTIERMNKQKEKMRQYWESEEWCSQFSGESLKKHSKEMQGEYLQRALGSGLDAFLDDSGICWIVRTCDQCATEYIVSYRCRNASFCSNKCKMIFHNTGEGKESRTKGLRKAFANSQEKKLSDQISVYNDLKCELYREPQKKEWENRCRDSGISFRLRNPASKSSNPYALKSFADLKIRASIANHRVISVESDGIEDVYNGTVDKFHTLGVITSFTDEKKISSSGILICQSEQTLESYEMCCLVENFPSRNEAYEEFQHSLKYSYLYAKTVTLIPTHWEQTNAVMLRNRRIGTSQSGIIDAFAKHGRSRMLAWSDRGYKYIRHMDNVYSDWLCIPRSIKVTSVKPSGTVSLLPNVSPGIHYREGEFYIRRVVIDSKSQLANIMRDAGYVVEVYKYDPENAVCVEFPVKVENFFKGASEVTMWEQLLNASDYQKFWADNQVSITVHFHENEKKDIANALSIFDTKLKGVAMLPYKHGYEQAPYEVITEEVYEERIKGLKKPDYSSFIEMPIGESGCDGESCQLPKH